MFNSIQIKNFKGLSDLHLEDVSLVNLIGGRNNVGKTSILEAIFLYMDKANPNNIVNIHGRRGFQILANTQDSIWGPIFKDFDFNNPIEITLKKSPSGPINKLTIKLNKKFNKPNARENVFGVVQSSTIYQPPVVSLDMIYGEGKNDQILHMVIEAGGIMTYGTNVVNLTPIDATFMSAASRIPFQEDAVKFGKLDVNGRTDELINFIKETIEPRLVDLSSVALENQSVIHAKLKGIERKIPVSFMGEGMARLISILIAISSSKDSYIFIDEIENGIHYSAIPKMWKGILKAAELYNCQVFATTHSYECLESAIKGIDGNLQDKFRYIRLERVDDKINSYNFSFEELETAIKLGWEVR